MTDRYDTSDCAEGRYQPGSADTVLLNKLGITDVERLEEAEFDLLAGFMDALLGELEIDQRITVEDLAAWHRRWLNTLYDWAGQYRGVNLSKGGFPFAVCF